MSEWRGLHNPERHEAFTVGGANPCVSCNLLCDSEYPCRCCLAAEVKRLTDALAERDRRIEKALAYCDDWEPISFAWRIQHILRGESDE